MKRVGSFPLKTLLFVGAWLPSSIATCVANAALPPAVFASPTNLNALEFAYSVATADVNADGRIDIVAASAESGKVYVYTNQGSAMFAASSNYLTRSPMFDLPLLAIGDLNGDGVDDIASTAGATGEENFVAVLLGQANGNFAPAVRFTANVGTSSVAINDFDGDHKQDLITANYDSSSLSLLRGNGDGTFQSATNIESGYGSRGIATGDFNNDGKPDVVVTVDAENRLLVFLGNGDGTFGMPEPYHLGNGSRPHYTAVCDLNHDGTNDLIAMLSGQTQISVLLGNGDGTFQDPVMYDTGTYPEYCAVADFNGDGNLDVVVAVAGEFKASLHLGRGDGTLDYPAELPLTGYSTCVVSEDFDGDGRPDIAVGQSLLLNRTIPSLRIRRVAAGVELRWPQWSGYDLESVSDLSNSNGWNSFPFTPVVLGSQNVLILNTTNLGRFFRLKHNP